MLALADASRESGEGWNSALQMSLVAMVDYHSGGKQVAAPTYDIVCDMCKDLKHTMQAGDASGNGSAIALPSEDDLNLLYFSALWNLVMAGQFHLAERARGPRGGLHRDAIQR